MMDGSDGLKADESSAVVNNTSYDGRNVAELEDPCASMLYISNLGERISANDIVQYFERHNLGRVVSIKVGQVHGVSQYCLCSLESPEPARRAVKVLHGLSTLGSSGLFVKHVGKELRAAEEGMVYMGGGGNPGNGMLNNPKKTGDAEAQNHLEAQDTAAYNDYNDSDGVESVENAVEKFQLEEKTFSSLPAAANDGESGNEEKAGGFTTLYLINLGMEITEEDLYNDFSAYGTVVATKVLRKDGAFHKALSGFIEFSLHVEAKRTKDVLAGKAYRGSLVYPRWAMRSLQKCLMKQQRNGGKIWSPASAAKSFRLTEKKDTLEETNPFNLYNRNGERSIERFAARKVDLRVNESSHGWRIPSSYNMPGNYVPAAVESMHLHQHHQTPVYMGYSQMDEYQHRMGYAPVLSEGPVGPGLVYGPGYCMLNPRAFPPYNQVMGPGMYHQQYGYDGAYTKQTRRNRNRNRKNNASTHQQE